MDLSQRPATIETIVCRPEEDGAFLFDPDSGNVSFINHTALAVFRLIDGERDIRAILDIFCRRYPEIETGQLHKDIIGIFDQLDENRFILLRGGDHR